MAEPPDVRIGIDARELTGQPTGVGRYVFGLLRSWAADETTRRHEFILYAHAALSALLPSPQFTTRVVPGRGGTLWEQGALAAAARTDRLDRFFAPGYTAPLLLRTPTVVAIHDVSFAAHPEWFSSREGIRRRFLTRRAAGRAAAVVTISNFSKGEIVTHLGVPDERVQVIPPGVDVPWRGAASALKGQRLGSARRVLYVGSIFNRRHVPDLIAAAGQLTQTSPEVSLDLVGDNRSYPRQDIAALIERQGAIGRLRWHRYVSDEELQMLYGAARAFAFLSEYEGLGLTPLEALSLGIPALLLDTPVARESCGQAALYVRKGDVAGTADALHALLFDESVRERLLSLAPAQLARYDWPTAARRTLEVIEGAR